MNTERTADHAHATDSLGRRALRRGRREVVWLVAAFVPALVLVIAAHIAYPGAFVGDVGELMEWLIVGGVVVAALPYAPKSRWERERPTDTV